MKTRMCLVMLGLALVVGAAYASTTQKGNANINVMPGQTVGDVSTVNGNVHVRQRGIVGKANTVNGSIVMEANSSANELKTIHGNVLVEKGAKVQAGISTGTGSITLDGAQVGGGLSTVSGNITVGAGSRVKGDIDVEKPNGTTDRIPPSPHIVIGPHAIVEGRLVFHRKVVLYLSNSARIGPIVGHYVISKFEGSQPPPSR